MSAVTVEWIAIADRLPDDDTSVMLAFADGEVGFGFLDGDQWRDFDAMPLDQAPTHWADLPAHPVTP